MFYPNALKYCEGNVRDADYFLDCSVGEYFYRVQQKAIYSEWYASKMKEINNK